MVDLNFLLSLPSVVQELQIQNHTRSRHLLRPIHSEVRVRGPRLLVTFETEMLT
jgi:hypothetical protein